MKRNEKKASMVISNDDLDSLSFSRINLFLKKWWFLFILVLLIYF